MKEAIWIGKEAIKDDRWKNQQKTKEAITSMMAFGR